MPSRDADGEHGPLAAKIHALFERQTRPVSDHQHARDVAASGNAHAPRRRTEYSHSAVARAIGSTDTYVTQLRYGQRDNPNLKLIQRLADFFGVDVIYLVKDEIPVGDLPLYLKQRSVRDRVNTLFEKVRPAGLSNPPFTDDAVAAAIGVDAAQISRLRDGSEDDPGLKLLRALAEYFGVPAEYLTTSDAKVIARIDEQLDLLADYLPVAARHLSAQVLADNASLGAIAAVLRHVRTQNARQTGGPDSP
ncbi:helix-turn-helix transcriptional regulator [Kutzneria sp. CA-103260]|uniref:helix-turn-helix transcriptional regulator n=1 Tax=Kutzneria sp. CA-103260 TaxID=2802641 RepID=UPI001BA7ECF2|nr:helix-turn-helix transcriptional regulator [Kutzneria sp. CA-103260]QUQ69953.1 helix-turn-helix protein [Kutzneria sp. CA-103260]